MAKRMRRKKKNCVKTGKRSFQLIVACSARLGACSWCACVGMRGQLSVAKPCYHRPLLWRDLVQEDYGLMSQVRGSKHRESKYAFVALRQFWSRHVLQILDNKSTGHQTSVIKLTRFQVYVLKPVLKENVRTTPSMQGDSLIAPQQPRKPTTIIRAPAPIST